MKRWQFVVVCGTVPAMTLEVIFMGTMRHSRSPTLLEALATISLCCVGTLIQLYRLRADRKTAAMVAGLFVMAAGSTLLAVSACP